MKKFDVVWRQSRIYDLIGVAISKVRTLAATIRLVCRGTNRTIVELFSKPKKDKDGDYTIRSNLFIETMSSIQKSITQIIHLIFNIKPKSSIEKKANVTIKAFEVISRIFGGIPGMAGYDKLGIDDRTIGEIDNWKFKRLDYLTAEDDIPNLVIIALMKLYTMSKTTIKLANNIVTKVRSELFCKPKNDTEGDYTIRLNSVIKAILTTAQQWKIIIKNKFEMQMHTLYVKSASATIKPFGIVKRIFGGVMGMPGYTPSGLDSKLIGDIDQWNFERLDYLSSRDEIPNLIITAPLRIGRFTKSIITLENRIKTRTTLKVMRRFGGTSAMPGYTPLGLDNKTIGEIDNKTLGWCDQVTNSELQSAGI